MKTAIGMGSSRSASRRTLYRKCREWRGKTALAPGKYEVVLEAPAVGMLLSRMPGNFDARQADEGRSFFAKRGGGNRIGERLFDEHVTIVSNPAKRTRRLRRSMTWASPSIAKSG